MLLLVSLLLASMLPFASGGAGGIALIALFIEALGVGLMRDSTLGAAWKPECVGLTTRIASFALEELNPNAVRILDESLVPAADFA